MKFFQQSNVNFHFEIEKIYFCIFSRKFILKLTSILGTIKNCVDKKFPQLIIHIKLVDSYWMILG